MTGTGLSWTTVHTTPGRGRKSTPGVRFPGDTRTDSGDKIDRLLPENPRVHCPVTLETKGRPLNARHATAVESRWQWSGVRLSAASMHI